MIMTKIVFKANFSEIFAFFYEVEQSQEKGLRVQLLSVPSCSPHPPTTLSTLLLSVN
jgi:hypothetical protein